MFALRGRYCCVSIDLTVALGCHLDIFEATSYYYDIEAWAARTNNCRNTDSMACMACSMPVLESFELAGIAPIGVSNDWWFLPERSATCGMCMRVYMCIHLCMHARIRGCLLVYVSGDACMHAYIRACLCSYLYAHMHACV